MLEVPEGADPHAALDAVGCSHCADGHGPDVNCRETAQACYEARLAGQPLHDGPCWNPPAVPDRPEGCAVCRPILHMGNATLVTEAV